MGCLVMLLGLFAACWAGTAAGPCAGVGAGLAVLVIAGAFIPPDRCELCGGKTHGHVRRRRVAGRRRSVCGFCDAGLSRIESDRALAQFTARPSNALLDWAEEDEISIELEPDPTGRRRIVGFIRRGRR